MKVQTRRIGETLRVELQDAVLLGSADWTGVSVAEMDEAIAEMLAAINDLNN